jgi:uncharacterized membrane protein YphA (DoxX/SURF4 family)
MEKFPTSYRYMSIWAIIGLVSLRLLIGWHFFMEGSAKVRDGGFSSVGFLGGAKGPLASNFQNLLPDFDGKLRLSKETMVAAYQGYAAQAKSAYGFDEEQSKRADAVVVGLSNGLDDVYGQWSQQITEYLGGFDRIQVNNADPKKWGVESLSKQREEIETKWRALAKPVLSGVDKVTDAVQSQLIGIAKPEQLQRTGVIEFASVGDRGPVGVKFVDKVIPYFDMSVGILLILGLCTQVAAWLAGVFLISIILTQFPGYPGTQPTYYQAIEMVGCFVLAFTDAGRYFGLDFIPWAFWRSRLKPISKSISSAGTTGTIRPGSSETVGQAGNLATVSK